MREARREAVPGHSESDGAVLQQAMAMHRSGDRAAAEAGYRAVLALDPDDPDALHLLGLSLYQRRAGREAYEHVRRAIALRPDVATFHHSLGRILGSYGKYPQALRSFTRVLRLSPGHRAAECDLASTLCDMKRFAEAAALLENSLARGFALARPGLQNCTHGTVSPLPGPQGALRLSCNHLNSYQFAARGSSVPRAA